MARLDFPSLPAHDPCTSTPAQQLRNKLGFDCCDGQKAAEAELYKPTLWKECSSIHGQFCQILGLLRLVVLVALSGAFTVFIIQAIMAAYSMCSSVKFGLTTAATGMSYMG